MSFEIRKISGRHFNRYLLIDYDSRTEAEIIPAAGAILNAFKIKRNGDALNIIDGYRFEEELEHPEKAFKSAKLSPFVCRISDAKYKWNEKEYAIKKYRLGSSAIHGLLFDVRFEVIGQEQTENSVSLRMSHEYNSSDPGYPFNYSCLVEYKLEKENNLVITTSILHKGKEDMPIADGWHPYFTFGGTINDLRLQISSTEMLEYNDELVPTGIILGNTDFASIAPIGEKIIDNGFVLDFSGTQPLCILRDDNRKMQLEIYPDKSYPYLQIYTPDDRQSIALENLSSAPNAFNNGMGLIVLKPGEERKFVTRYQVRVG